MDEEEEKPKTKKCRVDIEIVHPGLTTDLIGEVKKRPQLWDTTNPNYSSVSARNDAWESIALHFFPEYDQMTVTQQQALKINFKLKWRGLRTSFTKETKRKSKSAKHPYLKRKRPYIHYKALRFLEAHVGSKKQSDNAEHIDEPNDDERADESNEESAEIADDIRHTLSSPPCFSDDSKNENDADSWWGANADAENAIFDANCVTLDQESAPSDVFRQADTKRRYVTLPNSTRESTTASKQAASVKNGQDCFQVDESTSGSTSDKDNDEDKLFMLSLVSEIKKLDEIVKLEIKSELLTILSRARLRDNQK